MEKVDQIIQDILVLRKYQTVLKELAVEAGGWYGGWSYTGAFAQEKIKHNGAGGSSYTASNGTSFSTNGVTVTVSSSSTTVGGGAAFGTGSSNNKGNNGTASVSWASY